MAVLVLVKLLWFYLNFGVHLATTEQKIKVAILFENKRVKIISFSQEDT